MKKPESKLWYEVWLRDYKADGNWYPVNDWGRTDGTVHAYRYDTRKQANHIAKSYETHMLVRVVSVKQTRRPLYETPVF